MKKFMLLALGVVFSFNVHAAEYAIDNAHSQIGFAVKHLMVSTTKGTFGDYTGSINFDPADLASFKAEAIIQAKSIDTNNDGRDEHLRNPDFFDVAQFPTIAFVSKSLAGSEGMYTLVGDLTMHGVTKEVSFPVEISGPVKSPMGGEVIGLSGQLVVNRQDYGIKFNKTMDAGGMMLGDDVTVSIDLEAHKK
jgi:polyisoprenoid-binding protein YceI